MKNFRPGERIGQNFEIMGLDRLDFGKFPQKSFVTASLDACTNWAMRTVMAFLLGVGTGNNF